MTLSNAMSIVNDLKRLEEAVELPFAEWASQCHSVSLALVKSKLFGNTARVARGSCWGVISQHSWIVPNGDAYNPKALIVDPTLRFYAPQLTTQIWVGTAKKRWHVPKGSGSIWEYGRPKEPNGPIIPLPPELLATLSCDAKKFLELLGPLDAAGWHVLGNTPVRDWPSKEIFLAMVQTPRIASFVPMDVVGMLTDLNPGNLYW